MDFDEIWYLSFTLKHWANLIFVHTGQLQPLLYVQLKFTFMQISENNLWYSLKMYGDLETVALNMFSVFSVNLFVIVKADSCRELYRRYAERF
jgi:hypothetical protein